MKYKILLFIFFINIPAFGSPIILPDRLYYKNDKNLILKPFELRKCFSINSEYEMNIKEFYFALDKFFNDSKNDFEISRIDYYITEFDKGPCIIAKGYENKPK